MADETQAPEDEQEFAQWLDELESEEDKAVAVAEREDKQAQKPVQAHKAQKDDEAVVTRTEYLEDKFLASATDQEKALFAIYAHGVETPREMQAAIDLAKTNASEADKLMGADGRGEGRREGHRAGEGSLRRRSHHSRSGVSQDDAAGGVRRPRRAGPRESGHARQFQALERSSRFGRGYHSPTSVHAALPLT